jgi:DNA-binding response OmpR family regulator
MRLLIVEDDERIASFLTKGLRAEGYQPSVARTADEADQLVATLGDRLEFVLLDLGLPDRDGEEVLLALRRRNPTVPVMIVTARGDVADRVRGLDAGANDYVVKPFAFDELLARIRAALRSTEQPAATELVVADLRFDLLTKVAWRGGHRIDLAPREWALLELFMRYPTQVMSRQRILSSVWNYDSDPGTNVVDVYVGYLRRKLNRSGLEPLIQTVRGAGYRLTSS